ncbi:MAG TPA: trehalose-phosphatase [Ktedonobacteraceae bacterium]|jgi:trehalose 6-phosphate phosphatase|nr:trehalose-phosphatase [Ktedonobacteraceae bacterium]
MPLTDIHTVLSQRPRGLVLDIDGTLSPIAPTPEEARLYPGVASLLERAREHAHVAIVTGRSIESGAAIVNVEGLTYVGNHGLEWCDGLPSTHKVQIVPQALPFVEPGKQLLDLAELELVAMPGVLIERKRTGGSIHYRLSPDPEEAREKILALLAEPARELHMRLSEGKYVVEIRTPLSIDKGVSLRRFVELHQLRGVIYAGDDRTDLDAVLEVARLRQDGLAALAIVVEHNDTLPALLERADIIVHGVEGMVALLRQIVDEL